MKPQGWTKRHRKTLLAVNFILFMIPVTYYGYRPLLRYWASIVIIDERPRASDAIVVLAGGEPGRAWEAAELYRGKLAPYVVLTRDRPTVDMDQLRRYGIELVDGHGNYIRVLRGLGVPQEKIITVEEPVDDTFTELRQIRRLLEERKWKSVILVTTNYHTRRTRLTARYVLGPGFDLAVVASKHGGLDPDVWWKNNGDIRTFLIEFEKLVAYTLYIWPRMVLSGAEYGRVEEVRVDQTRR